MDWHVLRRLFAFLIVAIGLYLAAIVLFSASFPPFATGIKTIPAGTGTDALDINLTTNTVYALDLPANEVIVLDGKTNTVSTTIRVGKTWANYENDNTHHSLGVNPTTNTVYVAGTDGDKVTIIDGNSNKIQAVISVGANHALSVNPTTNTVYVANTDGNVTVIDGHTNKVTSTIHVGHYLADVAVNSLTNIIYAETANDVVVIDGKTNSVTTTIATPGKEGGDDAALKINPITNKVYFVGGRFHDLYEIDGNTNNIAIDQPAFDRNSNALLMPPDVTNRYVFTVNPITNVLYWVDKDKVVAIDASTRRSIGDPIFIGDSIFSAEFVVINSITDTLYISRNDKVGVIQVNTTPSSTTIRSSNRYFENLSISAFMLNDAKANMSHAANALHVQCQYPDYLALTNQLCSGKEDAGKRFGQHVVSSRLIRSGRPQHISTPLSSGHITIGDQS